MQKFNSRVKKPDESVSTYLSQLRSLTEHCNYGTKLDKMLRDRLVCGIEVPAIQKRLLAEPKLTLKRAMEIATAMETVEKNVETLKEGTTVEKPIHGVFQPSRKTKPPKLSVCYRCGQKSHKATTCPYKEAKCHKCGKVGHLQKVCRQGNKQLTQPPLSAQGKKKGMNLVESVATTYSTAEEYGMFPVRTTAQGSCKPFVVDMVLDGVEHRMEVDTGASVSVVWKETYESQFKNHDLRQSSI